jgi:hypothetical protein
MVIASDNVGTSVPGPRSRRPRRGFGRLIGLTFDVRYLVASA